MNTNLTLEQISNYRENGFVYHPGLLNADEVAELKAAVLETVAAMGKRKVAGEGADMREGKEYYDRVFTQRLNLWRINDTVKRTMLNPGIGRMLCQLEGVDGFRVWHDQALIKEPFANPTAWHLDNPYWSFHSHHSLSIWIALEDATLSNGCMWFIPGTHKLAGFDSPSIGADMSALFKVYPEMAKIDSVAVPMKSGDCSFHNGLTAHGAGPNMTRGRRIAMACAYMPEGGTFNGKQNILSNSYVQRLKVGDLLDDDQQNPRV